ncbi:putative DNA-binding transcriptional regulator [Clostridium puniceum]|uniref:Putative DNA-binding transcriptional regulator n=1 Tax=Clostridium puniceum TaxID=29367 RepID=A0A1S8TCF5_9CLOT|nr:MurR/RpiR family transcriptional regulator [Clostridium puniceum]OOM75302.1 putative DNA-binding transcriptional regulator [Clostridium puniceum]
MNIHRLKLIDSLFKIMEYTDLGDPDNVIATYFLKNYSRLGKLNIYDVADECFASRSSIRRFCKRIGFENFLDLKNEFKAFDYQYNYFMKLHEKINYREWYAKEINSAISEIDEMITNEKVEEIAQHIYQSSRVIFLSSYSSAQIIMEFQRPLVLLNKVVQVMTDTNYNVEVLTSLQETDLIFLVSTMGNVAKANLKILPLCKAQKLLITTCREKSFEKSFDDIYYLTKEDYTNIKSVQGKYGLAYLFDILYNVYLKKYGGNKK